MAAAIWADPAHHTVAGLISIRELATVTALIDNELRVVADVKPIGIVAQRR
ncbi:hypothetical protein [Bradyrhizobium sp. NBAIM14]|uniref:hypothetical protein n=1 Tax=Bradyrhizobium sp. NBAIM14 TaxID=2793814 RepID=UPI001CD78A45|nr:hypothetical protein [Bradyrhizobium sp. NBAIM14]MCA1500244.1 hypothetical protein [Bradyrhizobium sp. NBAIM14]